MQVRRTIFKNQIQRYFGYLCAITVKTPLRKLIRWQNQTPFYLDMVYIKEMYGQMQQTKKDTIQDLLKVDE